MATIQGIKVNDPTRPGFKKCNDNFDALKTEVEAATTAIAGLGDLASLDTVGPGDVDSDLLAAGRYTPTLTESTVADKIDTLTPDSCHFMRVLDQVTVHFSATLDVNGTGSNYLQFRISLPIASNFTDADDAAGSFTGDSAVFTGPGYVHADATNDEVEAIIFAGADHAVDPNFHVAGSFQYEVKA